MLLARKALKDWTSFGSSSSFGSSKSNGASSLDGSTSSAAPLASKKGNTDRRLTLMKHTGNSSFAPLVFSKDGFERILTEWALFCEFKHYALTVDLCMENIRFWESVVELEDLLSDVDPSYRNGLEASGTWALSRFLNSPVSHLAPIITVPQDLVAHFLYFHATFLARDAPLEVNIPGSVRNRIQTEIGNRSGGAKEGEATNGATGFKSNVFDQAVDEVVSLLYLNTFRGFVAYREKNGPIAVAVSKSSQGESYPRSERPRRFGSPQPDTAKSVALRRRMSFQQLVAPPSSVELDLDAQAAYIQIMKDSNLNPQSSISSGSGTLKRHSSTRRASLDVAASFDFGNPSTSRLISSPSYPISMTSSKFSVNSTSGHLPSPYPSPQASPVLDAPKPPIRKAMMAPTNAGAATKRAASPLLIRRKSLNISTESAAIVRSDTMDLDSLLSFGITKSISPRPTHPYSAGALEPLHGVLTLETNSKSSTTGLGIERSSGGRVSPPPISPLPLRGYVSHQGMSGGYTHPTGSLGVSAPNIRHHQRSISDAHPLLPRSSSAGPSISSNGVGNAGTLPLTLSSLQQVAGLSLTSERSSSLGSPLSPAHSITYSPVMANSGRSTSLNNPIRSTSSTSIKSNTSPSHSPVHGSPLLDAVHAPISMLPVLFLPDSPSFSSTLPSFTMLDPPRVSSMAHSRSPSPRRDTESPDPPPRISSSASRLAAATAGSSGRVRHPALDLRRRVVESSSPTPTYDSGGHE
ncbi:hypothetical protein HDU67_006922 [Dinochytrium kinnereticum]|nr:hypothetical protein HDU67_006922 [Dinochytrium kinnereticum]